MPLPVLDAATLNPTGEYLPLPDYFNPTINTQFADPTLGSMHEAGEISLPCYIRVAKTMINADTIEDFIPYILMQHSGAPYNTEAYRNILRAVFQALPDEHKWLIGSVRACSTRATTTLNVYEFAVQFTYPESISSGEIFRNFHSVPIFMSTSGPSSNIWAVTPDQFTTFAANVLVAAPVVAEKWAAIPSDRLVYLDDSRLNSIVTRAIAFANNKEIYYPHGSEDTHSLPWDWATPSIVARAIAEGHRVTLTLRPNGTMINFKAQLAAGDRRRLGRVLNYSTNVLDHLPYTIKGPKETTAPTYGVELESCSDYTPQHLIDAQKDLFFIMKQDSSIHGSKPQKYEIVTVPASLRAHKRLWAEFFEKIDYDKFDVTKDTGNGMHVHVGRSAFTVKGHVNRFAWFFTNPSNFSFMFAISERPNKTDISRWSPMPDYSDYTNRNRACRAAEVRCRNIRGTVHFKGHTTIEVRIFKGIVSYATIVKNIEFVDSVFHFTQHTNLSQITLKNYISWLNATSKNRYQTLKAFLSEVPVSEFITTAELEDYIWRQVSDYTIADMLNKAPFTVTNKHITVLNKKRRVRSFILKNGQVHCIRNNGGLLAKLDKSFSKKQTRGAATFTMNELVA